MPPGSAPVILRRFTRAFHRNPPRGGANFTSVRGAPLTRQHLNITRTPSNRYTKRAALALLCVPSIFTMAWRSSGATNDELIDNLFANEIASDAVQSAMRSCDRKNYVVVGDAYQDSPQTIGYGATISAPHMHAHCLSMLEYQLVPGARVLDVGSGTGYLTALSSPRSSQPKKIKMASWSVSNTFRSSPPCPSRTSQRMAKNTCWATGRLSS